MANCAKSGSRLTRYRRNNGFRAGRPELLEARRLLATVGWISDSSGFWDEGANWSNGTGPTNGDDVVIDRPAAQVTVTYRGLGADSIRGLNNSESFEIESGAIHWQGGTWRGGGTTTIDAGAELVIDGSDLKQLQGQLIRNRGTTTWLGGTIQISGQSNIWLNDSTGFFDIQTDDDVTRTAGSFDFENRGQLTKTAGVDHTILAPAGSSFVNNGVVEVQSGVLRFDAQYNQLGSAASETRLNGGSFEFLQGALLQAGSLTGSGTVFGVVVNDQATVKPGGDQVGVITITGDYVQHAGTTDNPATLAIQINGTTPGIDYDQLIVQPTADPDAVGGSVALDGLLSVTTNAFAPSNGDHFEIITGTVAVTGKFAHTDLPTLGLGLYWLVDSKPTGVSLDVVDTLADVSIVMAATPNPVLVGNVLSYVITVSNAGPNGASGVTVTDTLPANVVFVPGFSSAGAVFDPITNTVTFSLGFLPALQSEQVVLGVRPTGDAGGTTLTNTAVVSSETPDPDHSKESASVMVSVTALVDFVVSITGPSQVAIGDHAAYTITVKNNGPSTAVGFFIVDVLPANTIFLPAESTPGLNLVISAGAVVIQVPSLPAGGTTSIVVVIEPTVGAPSSGPTLTSTAAVITTQQVVNPATTSASITSTLLTAPQIVRLSRYGTAPQRTFLVATFDRDMDEASVGDVANYRLLLPGRDGRFGTKDDIRVPVTAAFYDPLQRSVTLALGRRLGFYTRAQLTIFAQPGDVVDAKGVALAGNGSGFPGFNYVRVFGHEIYAGSLHALQARLGVTAAPGVSMPSPLGAASKLKPRATHR